MKAKAIKSFSGQHGRFRRGQEFTAPEPYIQFLVKRGMAVPLHGKGSSEVEAAKSADARPSQEAPTGSPTGEAKPSSSSQEAPARKKRVSKKSKAAAE